ncbi:S-layer homology domain-containing protein [Sporosarcina sp. ACRSL]|uniref:S-layer homology domain-containing protein n=1 Tax=Sporosarcina sp. ACRSL TaxID=2918215 RepID=UPI001EF5CDF1|nr:S-layer homology domain-containing protein [Sporosarcina sp. ACRSL]MCG7342603.1 S-layer homology domain-containing protein [Sporosarcina sp. ACRSL]
MGNNQPNKYRKFIVGAASAALVASAVAPVASAAQFSDVNEGNSHAPAINALVEAGVINGYPDGTFKPNKTLTRSDVVKMMGKWLVSLGYEVPTDYKTNPRFTDHTSKTNDELLKYSALVKDNGVFNGYPDGSLGAGLDITRENMAIVLVRAYDAINKTDLVTLVKEQEFDKDVTDRATAKAEARPYIDVLDYYDITNPVAPQFNPKNTTTRAQFASFLYKTSNVEVGEVEDKEAPKLVYTGEKTLNVAYGAEFTVPTVTATDNVDEKVEVTTVITNEAGERLTAIDTKEYGTYKITYSAVDAAGNNAEELVLTVVVAEPTNLEVASVAGINATQVEVKFNLPVDKATLFEDGNSGAFKSNVVKLTSLDGVNPGALTGELSNDGKTLTITAKNVLSKRYDVVIDGLKSYNGKNIVKYEEMVTIAEDKTAPTVVKTDRVSASTFKVTFSEPLKSLGNVSYKLTNGTAVAASNKGVTHNFRAGAKEVTFTLGSDVAANQDVIATFIGTQDQAGNLISPNPTTVTFQKGDKDGVKPAVTSVTQTGAKSFAIKFTEELQTAPAVTIGGSAASNVEKDANDPTVYNVTTSAVLDDAKTVVISGYVDLSGETGETVSRVVSFVKDINAPKVASSAVVADETNGKEYLEITFDKNVVLGNAPTVDGVGSYVKDFVTTRVTADSLSATPVSYKNASNKKVVRVELDTFLGTTFDVQGATYTLDLTFANVASESGVTADTAKVTFTRGQDVTPASDAIVEVESVVQDEEDNNKVYVTFDKAVDGASATTVSNYRIDGAVVESVELNPVSNDKQVAVLTLQQDSNNFTGTRNINIANVKALGSTKAMEPFFANTVSLKENVAPKVTSAKLVGTDQVIVTFSEAVTATEGTGDFELLIGGSTVATKSVVTTPNASGVTTVTFTLGADLSNADLEKVLELKAKSTLTIEDAAGNNLAVPANITISR